MSKAHPGFKAVASKIAAKEGISKEHAGAILAHSTRHASKAAKKANPHLKRVKGGNTTLSTSSMKGHALAHDGKDNLAHKNAFKNGSQDARE